MTGPGSRPSARRAWTGALGIGVLWPAADVTAPLAVSSPGAGTLVLAAVGAVVGTGIAVAWYLAGQPLPLELRRRIAARGRAGGFEFGAERESAPSTDRPSPVGWAGVYYTELAHRAGSSTPDWIADLFGSDDSPDEDATDDFLRSPRGSGHHPEGDEPSADDGPAASVTVRYDESDDAEPEAPPSASVRFVTGDGGTPTEAGDSSAMARSDEPTRRPGGSQRGNRTPVDGLAEHVGQSREAAEAVRDRIARVTDDSITEAAADAVNADDGTAGRYESDEAADLSGLRRTLEEVRADQRSLESALSEFEGG